MADYVDMTKIQYGDHMLYVKDSVARAKIYETLKTAILADKLKIEIYKKNVWFIYTSSMSFYSSALLFYFILKDEYEKKKN